MRIYLFTIFVRSVLFYWLTLKWVKAGISRVMTPQKGMFILSLSGLPFPKACEFLHVCQDEFMKI